MPLIKLILSGSLLEQLFCKQLVKQIEARLLGMRPTSDLISFRCSSAADEMVAQAGHRWSSEYKSPGYFLFGERGSIENFPKRFARGTDGR